MSDDNDNVDKNGNKYSRIKSYYSDYNITLYPCRQHTVLYRQTQPMVSYDRLYLTWQWCWYMSEAGTLRTPLLSQPRKGVVRWSRVVSGGAGGGSATILLSELVPSSPAGQSELRSLRSLPVNYKVILSVQTSPLLSPRPIWFHTEITVSCSSIAYDLTTRPG